MLTPENDDERGLVEAADAFADAMKEKLLQKARGGFIGWNETDWFMNNDWLVKLTDHFAKITQGGHQEIDLANLAMFKWWRRHKVR